MATTNVMYEWWGRLEWCKEGASVWLFCTGVNVWMLICTVCERVICRCGVVWCCRPSWLPVVLVHQGDQGWGMLPWDYPVRVTWSACDAFKDHGFCVSVCVFMWLSALSVACECIPALHLNSDPSMNCLWGSSFLFFVSFSALSSILPPNQQISEEWLTPPQGAPLALLTRCLKAVCLFTPCKSLRLMATIKLCHIPLY